MVGLRCGKVAAGPVYLGLKKRGVNLRKQLAFFDR
jgi:hypothetical protein